MSDQATVQYDDGVPYDADTGEVLEQAGAEVQRLIGEGGDIAPAEPPAEPQPQNDNPELPLGIPEHVPGEGRGEAFVRLAEARTNRALKYIDLVGNLANRSNYDYDADDVAEILAAIQTALDDTARRFRVNSPRPEFRLRR